MGEFFGGGTYDRSRFEKRPAIYPVFAGSSHLTIEAGVGAMFGCDGVDA
jgi:hypothetical protein